ncbi:MAG: PorT family protein [Prevotellaceae bacterium]|jgi:hypothetical protein|nr:PorT family protein [Prevotellaceae bacterium]
MKQRIILLLLALCFSLPSVAQHRHEISIGGGYGLASLQYDYSSMDHKTGLGAQAGLNYNFYFAPQWSVKTGAGIALYNAEASLVHDVSYTNTIKDLTPGLGDLDFTYTYTGYKESPSVTLLTVPIMVQGETGGKTAFYAALGAKIGIPVSAQYKTSGQLKTTGYSAKLNTTFDDLKDYGIGEYTVDQTTDWDLNVSVQLAVEAGAKWRFTDRLGLYAGVYFDYGLTELNKKPDDAGTRLITYQRENPGEFLYGGLFNNSNKLYPVSVGITLRLSFGFGSL